MTAITRNPSTTPHPNPLQKTEASNNEPVFSPSSTVEEAKSRFATAVSNSVDRLMCMGHGRERASAEVLNEIADGSSPDEAEVRSFAVCYCTV
jgi:hypothetical protein